MLALEGYSLGLNFRFLEPAAGPPVAALGEVVQGDYEDPRALARFAEGLDVVTYEFENVPVEAARALAESVPVHPTHGALEMAQDRLLEKRRFRELGIPTAPFLPVSTEGELSAALEAIGVPSVLKTRRLGYDGKGQCVIGSAEEGRRAWEALRGRGPLLLEGFVEFSRELSILAVRGRGGERGFYPVVETHHREGVLDVALAPASFPAPGIEGEAEEFAGRILEALDYVGVLALELFETPGGLLANEMAPRVHNSGHWTLDGAECSQFENHLRAVCGYPLGSTRPAGFSAMVNILGEVPPVEELLGLPGVHLHLYDKSPRPGRKLGHVNVRGSTPSELEERLERLGRDPRPVEG